jgi:hypothetical protein
VARTQEAYLFRVTQFARHKLFGAKEHYSGIDNKAVIRL